MTPDESWLRKMADAEDEAGCISVGGLAADLGLPVKGKAMTPTEMLQLATDAERLAGERYQYASDAPLVLQLAAALREAVAEIEKLKLDEFSANCKHDPKCAVETEEPPCRE